MVQGQSIVDVWLREGLILVVLGSLCAMCSVDWLVVQSSKYGFVIRMSLAQDTVRKATPTKFEQKTGHLPRIERIRDSYK